MAAVSREDCAKTHGELNTRLAAIHTDVRWIKENISNTSKWQTEHEDEHKNLYMKIIAGITILSGAVATFVGSWVR